jgi:hypothetical protein
LIGSIRSCDELVPVVADLWHNRNDNIVLSYSSKCIAIYVTTCVECYEAYIL